MIYTIYGNNNKCSRDISLKKVCKEQVSDIIEPNYVNSSLSRKQIDIEHEELTKATIVKLISYFVTVIQGCAIIIRTNW